MVSSVTVEQMKEVDRLMIEEMGIDLLLMMENAGRNLAALARRMMGGDAAGKRVVILAGSGNNAGGGLAAARHLHNAGARAKVVLASQPARLKDAAAKQFRILERIGISGEVFEGDLASLKMSLGQSDLLLDALLGYSITGAPQGPIAAMIRAANESRVSLLALDLPSGLHPDTGVPFDPCIQASATMTLALPKRGLMNEKSRGYVGELHVADISVPPIVYERMGLKVDGLFRYHSIARLER